MLTCVLLAAFPASAQRQMEKLGRGVVAMRTSSTQVYIGWRMLGTDPKTSASTLPHRLRRHECSQRWQPADEYHGFRGHAAEPCGGKHLFVQPFTTEPRRLTVVLTASR